MKLVGSKSVWPDLHKDIKGWAAACVACQCIGNSPVSCGDQLETTQRKIDLVFVFLFKSKKLLKSLLPTSLEGKPRDRTPNEEHTFIL